MTTRILLVLMVVTSVSHAELMGSYTGQLALRRPLETVESAAALTEANGTIGGTIVLGGADAALSGSYVGQGLLKGTHARFRGVNPAGTRLAFKGRPGVDDITGIVRLRTTDRRRKGRLTLSRLPSDDDGSSCDAIFTANQAFFTDDVMAKVLVPICAACHAAGGQAAATRLRITPDDPAATARSTTIMVDTANPAGSLLLLKPLASVPHGGGAQLTSGSLEAATLASWADLVGNAQCSAPPPPTTGAGLFALHCAGCHGPNAAGLDRRPDVRCTIAERITDAVRRGRGTGTEAMVAFTAEALSNAQLDLIIAHLDGACSDQPADIYAANCATCHGATAGGGSNADGVPGPDIRCTETHDYQEALAGDEAMPAFPPLLGSQLVPLAQYVRSFCVGD